ncbi:TetR/AcrR family transcriptional regulator [Microlunatus speluncae]|uniref:TetR/AcrR family transcriptional regulator n=1 Tax=Microlunatus speluncae TaxID=2594267 RepID=UPI00126667F5|nr:TetR family transcriptional regulator [Microlunatus speluncae]
MGLRELKAERNRHRIAEVALDLFLTQGFDETTMEQIAERAEVGSTTLYRYFPSKDLIALEPFRAGLALGEALRGRPAEEPLAESLGAVVIGVPGADFGDLDRFARLRELVDRTPGPRAKLWDLLAHSRDDFAAALADRMGRDPAEPEVALTALIAFGVWHLAWDRWWAGDRSVEHAAVARTLLAELSRVPVIIPAAQA